MVLIMTEVRTVYGVKHKNEEIRAASRSGGVFTALSDVILENGGSVYGCTLTDDFYAVHDRAVTKEQRDAFRGSKYIQSSMGDVFKQVENDLKADMNVLFSGTPCQVHSIINYLNIKKTDTKKLFTIDIICHGVPSPMVWSDYLNINFGKEKIEKVDFRDKTNFGWRAHFETITADGEEHSSRNYTELFFSHLILRDSCFECQYKNTDRISDITIGDFWRIENNDKEYDDDKGISLVMVNTQKGSELFKACKNELTIRQYPLAGCIQPALSENYKRPAKKDVFWSEYDSADINRLIDKYTGKPAPTIKQKLRKIIGDCLRPLFLATLKLIRKSGLI